MTPAEARSDLRVEHVDINELVPDPANPRRMSAEEMESLTRSLAQFGLVDPIIARRQDKTVIGGHQRLHAALRLGLRAVPVIFLDVTKDEARLLNLSLNRISGEWDQELLGRLLADLRQVPDVDLSLSGFSDNEVNDLLKRLGVREKRERPESFDVEAALQEARKAPEVAPGDFYQLGEHVLLCGDATDADAVDRLLAGRKASMFFGDPPYNVRYGDHGGQQRGSRRRRIANDAMPPETWQEFVRAWAKNLLAVVDGAIYVCMSTRAWATLSTVLDELGAHWSDTIIWAKDRFVLGRADYQRQYEPIWYGWREGADHHWCGDRNQGDVWHLKRPSESELHPTTKPLELVERAIENSSRPGDFVLDLFLGSGTTLVACERTGRTCAAMELDPHYAWVAMKRWEAFTGQKAIKEPAAA